MVIDVSRRRCSGNYWNERTEEWPEEVRHSDRNELLGGRNRVVIHATKTLRNRNMLTIQLRVRFSATQAPGEKAYISKTIIAPGNSFASATTIV